MFAISTHDTDTLLVKAVDVDRAAGNPAWEGALFRCFNEIRASGGRLLVASREPLSSLEFDLPDLKSRLAWGVRLKLAAPDDEAKSAILRQRARSLHIELPDEVEAYVLRTSRRDMASLLAVVEGLKEAAFVTKRKITVPLATLPLRGWLKLSSKLQSMIGVGRTSGALVAAGANAVRATRQKP